jgi:hypothetical protein
MMSRLPKKRKGQIKWPGQNQYLFARIVVKPSVNGRGNVLVAMNGTVW